MLLQFRVNNFASIKDTATLSMNTASNKATTHSFQVRNTHLLNTAVIYGANASGKSNVLKAMQFMRSLVLNLTKVTQSTEELLHHPFWLNTATENASSWFEMVFFIADVKYRYGFEADKTTVYAEWLYSDEKGKESRLFERDKEDNLHYVNKLKFKEGVGIKVPDNHLILWRCDQNNGEISRKILQWFESFTVINRVNKLNDSLASALIRHPKAKADLLRVVKVADFGIEDMICKDNDILITHKIFNVDNEYVTDILFYLNNHESEGTKKFVTFSAPVLTTLEYGTILVIDELEASLHPMLTEYLINLFNNKEINKHNAQLIFTTHSSHLLADKLFDRDQIWFTEKDQYGSTSLYSLLEFRKNNSGIDVRENDNLEKRYLQGRFGGVPNIGEW